MTRSCWVDAGNDPDPAKFANHGITVPYLDARWVAKKPDPLGYLKWVKAMTGIQTVGLFLCDPVQWKGTPTGAVEWADWAYDLVQHQCAPGTSRDFPRVDLNYEQDNAKWLVDMLVRWRLHSPQRTTSFVVQNHKAPIYVSAVPALNRLNITVKPQCYQGEEMDRVESAFELEMWRDIGVEKIEMCLDAKQLGLWWQGTAFTMGRLPNDV